MLIDTKISFIYFILLICLLQFNKIKIGILTDLHLDPYYNANASI